ncbi:hypothetical protein G5C51_25920 [Streptomyces sp. A7024]|uniref:Integral membrane protein n=1 Tax=Streptomyces coryli TaxID=1128680 RepID=A0A6G4U7G4_9ACTN|nr:glycosyltransferase family 39 protein [Streptomyces coryli]NGN67328.1 hypothetical protein [Streptomyces coryli]
MTDLAMDAPPKARRRLSAMRGAVRRAAPALLLYAAVRALGVAALAVSAGASGKSAHELLSARWDSLWYVRVVAYGYDFEKVADDGRVLPAKAFFPLLPWLEKAGSAVTSLSPADVGLVVSALAGLAAAAGLYAIGELLYGRRAGIMLAVLWAALPVGIVQSMAYSESLFTALAAWGVYAVLTGRWLCAGTLSVLAGLTRPVGAAVVAAVWVGVWLAWREGRRGGADGGPRPRMVIAAVIAPLGWVGYVVWVGFATGKPLGYLDVQGAWGNGFDGGWAFARFIAEKFGNGPAGVAAGLGLLVAMGLLVWVCVLCVRQRQPWPLLAYAGVVTVLAVAASGYFGSKPRLLLPAFPLLLPVAVALARARPARAAAVLVVTAVTSAAYGAFWLLGSGPP